MITMPYRKFLLTRPSRGATELVERLTAIVKISTHTPLTGRDFKEEDKDMTAEQFLLTRPSRGATTALKKFGEAFPISTHTPLAGRDLTVLLQ